MLNRNEPTADESDWDRFLFNMVYLFAAGVAAYHSAVVFLMSDPWYVAVPAALVVDGLTAYSVSMLGRWRNSQRTAGFIGIGLFVIISASAQIIARYEGAGVAVPAVLRWISLALVPLSSTGAVVALGAIKYFGNRKTTKIAEDRQSRQESLENSVTYAPALPAISESSRAVDAQLGKMIEAAPDGESDSIFAPIQNLVKRGRGRPKKNISYAKDVPDNSPKL